MNISASQSKNHLHGSCADIKPRPPTVCLVNDNAYCLRRKGLPVGEFKLFMWRLLHRFVKSKEWKFLVTVKEKCILVFSSFGNLMSTVFLTTIVNFLHSLPLLPSLICLFSLPPSEYFQSFICLVGHPLPLAVFTFPLFLCASALASFSPTPYMSEQFHSYINQVQTIRPELVPVLPSTSWFMACDTSYIPLSLSVSLLLSSVWVIVYADVYSLCTVVHTVWLRDRTVNVSRRNNVIKHKT